MLSSSSSSSSSSDSQPSSLRSILSVSPGEEIQASSIAEQLDDWIKGAEERIAREKVNEWVNSITDIQGRKRVPDVLSKAIENVLVYHAIHYGDGLRLQFRLIAILTQLCNVRGETEKEQYTKTINHVMKYIWETAIDKQGVAQKYDIDMYLGFHSLAAQLFCNGFLTSLFVPERAFLDFEKTIPPKSESPFPEWEHPLYFTAVTTYLYHAVIELHTSSLRSVSSKKVIKDDPNGRKFVDLWVKCHKDIQRRIDGTDLFVPKSSWSELKGKEASSANT